MERSSKRRDYRQYAFNRRELFTELVKGGGIVAFIAWFFYRSLWAAIPLSVLGIFYVRQRRRTKLQAGKSALLGQFKECILSVAASLRAGYAVENAFLESVEDMKMLFGEEAYICRELDWIRRGLIINIPLEELLLDLAKRSGLEELEDFSEVFSIAKRSGGNLPEIIRSSAELIGERVEAEEEIRTLLAERMLEQKIMNVMPFGILTYIGVSYGGYFDPLYHNLFGTVIMTACLAVYLTAFWLAGRILEGACGSQI